LVTKVKRNGDEGDLFAEIPDFRNDGERLKNGVQR